MRPMRPVSISLLVRPNVLRTSTILAGIVAGLGVALFVTTVQGPLGASIGNDLDHYLAATRRWLESGTPYVASEVAGPFTFGPSTFLHPPISLLLFLPFLVMPAWLWWAIPLGLAGASIIAWRPARWSWPVIAVGLADPRFHGALLVGNTDLWVLAGVALGLRHGWPALIVAAKPTLPFFLLIGANRRSWWLGLALIALAGLIFARLWFDWVSVIQHAPGGLLYSIPNIPWLLMPVIAWLARRDEAWFVATARARLERLASTGLSGTIVAVRRRNGAG